MKSKSYLQLYVIILATYNIAKDKCDCDRIIIKSCLLE